LVYEDVIEDKKKVINDWEIFVKNFKQPCTNFYLPISKINKGKLHNLENELFSFTSVNFSELNQSAKNSSIGYNITSTISTSPTPCNSDSKKIFLQSNFSTNANTINNSKYASNRKHYSPDQIDSQKTSTINFYGGSPKILSTQYSGNNMNNYNPNGSVEKLLSNINNQHSGQEMIINTNPNINSFNVFKNPTTIITNSNSKNFSANFSNMILNKDANNVFNNNLGGIIISDINSNSNNQVKNEAKNIKKTQSLEDKDLNDRQTNVLKSKEMEKYKRAHSSIVRKLNNKQLQININPNLIPNTNRNAVLNVPSTTNAKNTKSINLNPKLKIQFNKFDDSNESIKDIIRNLNEEKLFFNFNKKTERPILFKISDKIKRTDTANVIKFY